MPINKNAFRRYQIIDQLVRNKMRSYPTMQEIVDACYDKLRIDVSPETIQKDMNKMRQLPPDGLDAPICTYLPRTFETIKRPRKQTQPKIRRH